MFPRSSATRRVEKLLPFQLPVALDMLLFLKQISDGEPVNSATTTGDHVFALFLAMVDCQKVVRVKA